MRPIVLTVAGEELRADLDRSHDISIALDFDGLQPNYFGVPPASSVPVRADGFIGDTREHGSCNVEEYRFVAHCNGTHTECVGHVTDDRVSVRDALRPGLVVALLMSIKAAGANESGESTSPAPKPNDLLISAKALEAALKQWPERAAEAWIIRTAPNRIDKPQRKYRLDNPPAYFTQAAVELAVARGVEHLVLDLPSLDRSHDEGRLTGHRIFWGLPAGSQEAKGAIRPNATVTELAFIPTAVRDGWYLLDLQIAPFASDAAPSRPILYPLLGSTPGGKTS